MSYARVLPRDLFNEALLLKNIGMLCLNIHDEMLPGMSFSHDGTPFDVQQDPASGSLFVSNVHFFWQGEKVEVFRTLNDKESWGLYLLTQGEDEYSVFTGGGAIDPLFLDALE